MHPEAALEAMIRALVEDCAPFVKEDWPFDNVQGLCFFCEGGWQDVPGPRGGRAKHVWTGAHVDGCAWETARAYLFEESA